MNTLVTAQAVQKDNMLRAITASTKLGERTKAQYTREVVKALDAGVNLYDAGAVGDYAGTLSTSSRSFLRAALKKWTKRQRMEANNSATPDNMATIGATLARLDGLDSAIEEEPRDKGTPTHIWLTPEEVKRLVASVRGRTARRDKVALSLLVGAGLRRDEAVNLTWSCVKQQGERTVLAVEGKGKKKRTVPVSPALEAMLEDWRAFCQADKSERIVRGLAAGGTLSDSLTSAQLFNIVRKHGKRIAKPELSPHDLRRTYARIGYDNGVPLDELAQLLGHSSTETTRLYIGATIRHDRTPSDFVPL